MNNKVKPFCVHPASANKTVCILTADSETRMAGLFMGRKKKSPPDALGERLATLRKARGFTQVELAQTIGTSQRMIAYYETQGGNMSADVVAKLAAVLSVTVDEIVGVKRGKVSGAARPPHNLRLMRKIQQVEKLPSKDRRSVLQFIDALVERESLRKAQGAGL